MEAHSTTTSAASFPEGVADAIDRLVAPDTARLGFVARDGEGRHALVEPAGEGAATLATVARLSGETPSAALARCVREQLRVIPRAVFPLPGPWYVDGEAGVFFAGLSASASGSAPRVAGATLAQRLHWCDRDDAFARLQRAPDANVRRRDLLLLAYASSLALSTERRLVLAVQALHRMGFERLGLQVERSRRRRTWRFTLGPPDAPLVHTHEHGQRFFGWDDACFDAPDELAARILYRAPDGLFDAWGVDAANVAWLDDVLASTAPEGVPVAVGDAPPLPGQLTVERHARVLTVPGPPPARFRGSPR